MPSVEVQDSQHQVLNTVPVGPCDFVNGWGPFAIEKGKAARTFTELTTASPYAPHGITPVPPIVPGPGVYYLVSIWSPHVLDTLDAATPDGSRKMRDGKFGGPYATARSLPVRIEIEPGTDH